MNHVHCFAQRRGIVSQCWRASDIFCDSLVEFIATDDSAKTGAHMCPRCCVFAALGTRRIAALDDLASLACTARTALQCAREIMMQMPAGTGRDHDRGVLVSDGAYASQCDLCSESFELRASLCRMLPPTPEIPHREVNTSRRATRRLSRFATVASSRSRVSPRFTGVTIVCCRARDRKAS